MTSRDNVIKIFNAAVASVQPQHLMPAHLFINDGLLHIIDQTFPVSNLPSIYVIGAGKASAAMALATEQVIANFITSGLVVTKYNHALSLQKIRCMEAAHPVPDERGVRGTQAAIELLQQAKENDIIICLISGGASALWADVPEGASLEDVQDTFQSLLNTGANIREMNTVRKHLSAVKGGRLLKHAPAANWFTFIISDVPGDDPAIIASGPTVPDNSTYNEAKNILEKYGLWHQLPLLIVQHIEQGINGSIAETPKQGDLIFNRVHNKIIGSNAIALQAAMEEAKRLGYHVVLVDDKLYGDAGVAGCSIIEIAATYKGNKPACLLWGGETTVTVTGGGKGGRNQHLALTALVEMAQRSIAPQQNKLTVLSAGTDGTDGPTDAAGAIADTHLMKAMETKKLDAQKYLEEHDAYHFFEQVEALLKTGATQTNVMDMVIVLVE